jgi:hypothetical protein
VFVKRYRLFGLKNSAVRQAGAAWLLLTVPTPKACRAISVLLEIENPIAFKKSDVKSVSRILRKT